MVIIQFAGGLGNQIFQYAFSLNFLKNCIPIKYDLSFYQRQKIHNGFELKSVFEEIDIAFANYRDIFHFLEKKIVNGEKKYLLKEGCNIIREEEKEEFKYLEHLLKVNNSYFQGYWQNRSYFEVKSFHLREKLTFKDLSPNDLLNNEILLKIQSSNSVSIHIRRGDYLKSPIHNILDINYYKKAVEIIENKITEPIFFIFSDDIGWVKNQELFSDCVFVDNNKNDTAYIDMQLMSLCKHNIIANSTFSWWAAWLNKNTDKIVVSPKTWFKDSRDISGLFCEDWILF